ncbi:MAG: hypothetical protein WDW38_004454 [Sanguina aurantia]
MQWYVQDGCWQADASWHSTGTLPVSPANTPVTDAQILALRPPPAHASLVYAITTSDGKAICGEITQQVSAVRKLLSRVQELRFRAENPKAPSDLFGEPAPSTAELENVKAEAEAFLCGGIGRASADADGADSRGLQSRGGRSGSRTGSPGSTPTQGGKATPGTKRTTPDTTRGGTPLGAVLSEGCVLADVGLLTRLEALLCLDGGLEVCDVTLAGWLAKCLHGGL